MTVARGPLDDWQGRKEPRVLEVREATENAASVFLRGPAETWSSAERFRGVRTSGTGPTQIDFGHATLALSLLLA